MMRAALYVRVSTPKKTAQVSSITGERVYEQNPEVQERKLLDYVSSRGWVAVKTYMDRISTTKENRPGLVELMAAVRKRLVDAVVVFRFDRFARSVRELVVALDEFRALKVDFVSIHESVDTSTPSGRLMFAMIAAMAEFEREIMRERILAGMEYAAEHGTKSGKPSGRPRKVFDRQRALDMMAGGDGWAKIAAGLGVSVSTLRRHVQKGSLGRLAPGRKTKAQAALGK